MCIKIDAEMSPLRTATMPDTAPSKKSADDAIEDALARCGRGEIQDMKTEVGLRRLAEKLR